MARAKARGPAAGETYVALLRGINVGGKNPLPMKALAELLADAGLRDVTTYIQSGNIVFRAPDELAPHLPEQIAQAIQGELGLRVPVVVRARNELRRVVESNPFLRAGSDVAALHVAFLANAPSRAQVAGLDAKRSPPDEFVVQGREIYLRCPNGLGRTKLTNAYFDSKLKTVSTVRNWNTVLKLLELAGSSVPPPG